MQEKNMVNLKGERRNRILRVLRLKTFSPATRLDKLHLQTDQTTRYTAAITCFVLVDVFNPVWKLLVKLETLRVGATTAKQNMKPSSSKFLPAQCVFWSAWNELL